MGRHSVAKQVALSFTKTGYRKRPALRSESGHNCWLGPSIPQKCLRGRKNPLIKMAVNSPFRARSRIQINS